MPEDAFAEYEQLALSWANGQTANIWSELGEVLRSDRVPSQTKTLITRTMDRVAQIAAQAHGCILGALNDYQSRLPVDNEECMPRSVAMKVIGALNYAQPHIRNQQALLEEHDRLLASLVAILAALKPVVHG